jgi:hypothetical protein
MSKLTHTLFEWVRRRLPLDKLLIGPPETRHTTTRMGLRMFSSSWHLSLDYEREQRSSHHGSACDRKTLASSDSQTEMGRWGASTAVRPRGSQPVQSLGHSQKQR